TWNGKPAFCPARLTIQLKLSVVNGPPRSLTNTNGDFGDRTRSGRVRITCCKAGDKTVRAFVVKGGKVFQRRAKSAPPSFERNPARDDRRAIGKYEKRPRRDPKAQSGRWCRNFDTSYFDDRGRGITQC